ncbi:bifunctional metallophosphatase/5'-nucleotidase [Prevotella sp.]|uniref:bifunctional metallophosphatase/5'-nucleotidase n=1 Tax=Prevotella sp. TaxID=59823 RepID=UPI002F95285A
MVAQTKTVSLRVIETSDVHGCFFPYDFINRKPKKGSLARVSSYVKSLRKEYGENVILLDNGDILQGQPTCYYYNYINTKSRNVASDIVNYMRYDVENFGNHDVETGHSVYDKWVKELNCPVLGANIIDKKTNKPYAKPYTILRRDGVKIAVIGLLTPAIPNWLPENLWTGLYFEDMVKSARKWVKHVRRVEKPDVIIGLFHSGKEGGIVTKDYEEDASLRVAKEVPGFDLVLFGHDHTRFNGTVKDVNGKDVVCLDPANNALTVVEAKIDVVFEKGKRKKTTVTGSLVDISNHPIDEDLVRAFKSRTDEVSRFVNQEIGEFKNAIYSRDCFFGSSAFTDLIQNLQLQITGADISFNAPLLFNATINAGPVFVADMFNLYKYENQLYVMKLTGEEIRKYLEMSYSLWVNTMTSKDDHLLLLSETTKGDQQRLGFKNFSFNFDSATGIDYTVDVTKPNGQKVSILRMSNGLPFDEHAVYKVAINSYRGNGGGELLTKGAGIPKEELDKRIIWRSERDQRYYLMKEIEKQKVLDPKPNHNWKFIPESWTLPAAKRDSIILFGNK